MASRSRWFIWPICLCILVAAAAGAEAGPPTERLQHLFAATNQIIEDPAIADPMEKLAAVKRLVSDVGDWEAVASRVLGREWHQRGDAERNEFAQLFADVLQRIFVTVMASRARLEGGTSVAWTGETIAGEEALVSSLVEGRGGTPFPVVYRMGWAGGQWKLRDVTVEGVSLVDNYRAQILSILRRSSYPSLLADLRHAAGTTTGPQGAVPGAPAALGVGGPVAASRPRGSAPSPLPLLPVRPQGSEEPATAAGPEPAAPGAAPGGVVTAAPAVMPPTPAAPAPPAEQPPVAVAPAAPPAPPAPVVPLPRGALAGILPPAVSLPAERGPDQPAPIPVAVAAPPPAGSPAVVAAPASTPTAAPASGAGPAPTGAPAVGAAPIMDAAGQPPAPTVAPAVASPAAATVAAAASPAPASPTTPVPGSQAPQVLISLGPPARSNSPAAQGAAAPGGPPPALSEAETLAVPIGTDIALASLAVPAPDPPATVALLPPHLSGRVETPTAPIQQPAVSQPPATTGQAAASVEQAPASIQPRATTEPPAATAPQPVPHGSEAQRPARIYWVQLGWYADVAAATRAAERFKTVGPTIVAGPLTRGSGVNQELPARLMMGPFSERADAEAALKRLAPMGISGNIAEQR
jgi:ABC-type transporter MlaC component